MGPSGPLVGFKVLDLAGPPALHCTKLLADLGADIIKVEPPGGDPARRIPPFKDDVPGDERSLYFLHFNANKRSITLDLENAQGAHLFQELVRKADVVVEAYPPDYLEGLGLGYDAFKEVNRGIVVTSVTPFGRTGPYRDYKADDMVAFAMGGLMAQSGEPDSPPLVAPGELAYSMASAFAALGTLVALFHRMASGEGQHVDVSIHASSVHIAGYAVPVYSATKNKGFRKTWGTRNFDLHDAYPCKDGYARIFVLPQAQWESLLDWLGNPEELMAPVLGDAQVRRENSEIIDPYIEKLCQRYTKAELYEEGQRRHIAVSPINTPEDFILSPQTVAREFFVPVHHPEIGDYRHLGPIHKFSETPGSIYRTAPLIGEHNQEIYCGELGLSKKQLVDLKAVGVV